MSAFFFAYCAEADAFDPVAHAVEDEAITELSISQQEGDFASLQITVINPGEGLLNSARQQWCWLSWDDGTAPVPLFHGRIAGVPESVDGETVRLLFTAQPTGYETVRADLAETLKVLPYYDAVWITGDTDDPDNVLEGYGARWHIDRTSLAVTISDELEGEDGMLSIGEADSLYDGLSLSYSNPPLSQVTIDATLTWTQTGAGTIDLTESIYHANRAAGSIYDAYPGSGIISSMTGDGLIADWPEGGASLDGGWTVNDNTYAEEMTGDLYTAYNYHLEWQAPPTLESSRLTEDQYAETIASTYFNSGDWQQADIPVYGIQQRTLFDWNASRGRTEIFRATVVADIQPLLAEPLLDEHIGKVTVSASDTVTEPDADGVMAIGDTRRKSYLDTDRGRSSVEYLLLLARASLRRSARAVEVECKVPWASGIGVTLRHNAQIVDYRIPGGEAAGKLTAYELTASGSGEHTCTITIGCAIGYGGTVSAQAGEPDYVDDGYVGSGYQTATGATLAAPTGDVVYQALTDFVVDDDGVDLLTLDETTAVQSIEITGGMKEQVEVLSKPQPLDALADTPTKVCIQLVPVADTDFETIFSPTTEPLPIPRQIDLEAARLAA